MLKDSFFLVKFVYTQKIETESETTSRLGDTDIFRLI